jgi:hypothetical protein
VCRPDFIAPQPFVGTPALTPDLADIMRIWLEYDPVTLALLAIGLAAVEVLAFIL